MQEIWLSIANAAKSMTLAEIIAVGFAIASVIYSKKVNILVYPTGIISVSIYIYLCYKAGIYGDLIINVFYFIMSVYGWYNWIAKKQNKTLEISSNTLKENLISLFTAILLYPLLYWFLITYTDSTIPIADAITTALFFVGMWLMAWKRLENWLFLIAGNLISIPLYAYKGLHLTALLYITLTLIAVLGFIEWRKKISVQ